MNKRNFFKTFGVFICGVVAAPSLYSVSVDYQTLLLQQMAAEIQKEIDEEILTILRQQGREKFNRPRFSKL